VRFHFTSDRARVELYFKSQIILIEILVVELLPLENFNIVGGVRGSTILAYFRAAPHQKFGLIQLLMQTNLIKY
jgi:hypothetical protein